MKPSIQLFIAGLCLAAPIASFAQGHSGAGGGDQCKNEIDKDRLEIKRWIERDEAKDLNFGLAKIQGQSYADYKQKMLAVLAEGKVIVTCYLDPARIGDTGAQKIASEQGVSYRAVTVDGSVSACINYEDPSGISHIDCNYDTVMNEHSLGKPNYVNTHHEYASIAKVEERASQPSDMSISNQLSEFERTVQVTLLGPKKTSGYYTRLRPGDDQYQYVSYRIHAGPYGGKGSYVSARDLDRANASTEMFLNDLGLAKETRADMKADLEIFITIMNYVELDGQSLQTDVMLRVCPGRGNEKPDSNCTDKIAFSNITQNKSVRETLNMAPLLSPIKAKIMAFQDDITRNTYGVYNPRKIERKEIEYQQSFLELESDTSPKIAQYLYEVAFAKLKTARPNSKVAVRYAASMDCTLKAGVYACTGVKDSNMARAIYNGPMVAVSNYYKKLGLADGTLREAQVTCTKVKKKSGFKYTCEFDHN